MTPKLCGGCRNLAAPGQKTLPPQWKGVDGWCTVYAKPAEQVAKRCRQDNHRFPSKKI